MNSIMQRFGPVVGMLMLVLSVLACNMDLEKSGNIVYATSTPGPSGSDILFTISGTGTDTWLWGESGLSCDGQNNFELTVTKSNDAKLISKGSCFYERMRAEDSCLKSESDLPCGLVLLGGYNPDTSTITWDSCNGPTGHGEGTATVSGDVNSGANLQVSGSGICSFENLTEWHRLDFILSTDMPKPTP